MSATTFLKNEIASYPPKSAPLCARTYLCHRVLCGEGQRTLHLLLLVSPGGAGDRAAPLLTWCRSLRSPRNLARACARCSTTLKATSLDWDVAIPASLLSELLSELCKYKD